MHAVFKDRLAALVQHYLENGVTPRMHGNKGKLPKHALDVNDIERVVTFIHNYAEENAVLLPGRIPGYKRDDLKLLPSSVSKVAVHKLYSDSCEVSGHRAVSERTFYRLWQQYVPNVLPMKPMSDLCWTCQKNSALLVKASKKDLEEKTEALVKAEEHLWQATTERSFYNSKVQECRRVLAEKGVSKLLEPGNSVPNSSNDFEVHYSFDFAQQLHYPHNPMQPGPIFFKTPRKCAVFGVVTEGLPQMVIFLLDEASITGKGANCVISLLDYFFENYGVKETHLHLHADNCSGQNKNNSLVQYLLWCVVTGKHQRITLSFMVAGHTKFAPNSMFGLFKRKYRNSKVDCLADIVNVVRQASPSGVLIPQLCGDEMGNVIVPMYGWNSYLLQFFKKLPSIKPIHHIECRRDGSVMCKILSQSEPVTYKLLKCDPDDVPCEKPATLVPEGLSNERKMYLFNEIREFVAERCRDLVCPNPTIQNKVQSDENNNAVYAEVLTPAPPHTRGVGSPKKIPHGLVKKMKLA
ncbi:uncharacterized protein LOC143729024 [Siphateles boraxobius]|uniref:uncharacterized protein LOC143729024 n=1 Tax=Siphateles boraxobius TaxID=180520 RepID=UPI0040634C1E